MMIEPQQFRDLMAGVCAPVTVVTTTAEGSPYGTRANPLQRIWLDSAVAARHAVVLPVIGYEVYGKALLGRDDHITLLV